MNDPAIEIDSLTVRFGRRCALQDLSLSVERGKIFGFLGENGAGKTTTIRVLMGLLRPTSGRVRGLGDEVAAATVEHDGLARQQPVPVATRDPRSEDRVEQVAAGRRQREAAL